MSIRVGWDDWTGLVLVCLDCVGEEMRRVDGWLMGRGEAGEERKALNNHKWWS